MRYRVPKRDFEFVLREVMDIEQLTQYSGYEEVTWEMLQMIADQVAEIAEDIWFPSNQVGDRVGSKIVDGRWALDAQYVTTRTATCVYAGLGDLRRIDRKGRRTRRTLDCHDHGRLGSGVRFGWRAS